MMSKYAANTRVPVDRSKVEIERILSRYGAEGFGHYTKDNQAMVAFEIGGRAFRINLPMPTIGEFMSTPAGQQRSQSAAQTAVAKACRQRWRAICLLLTAKLEAVELGITTIDAEFMPHMVLPGGQTLGEKMLPHLADIVMSGNVHKFLPDPEVKL